MQKYIIIKKSRMYEGGPGYAGPTCDEVDVEPCRVYDSLSDAQEDAYKLSDANPVGFRVQKYESRGQE